jgi:hypothetical protein
MKSLLKNMVVIGLVSASLACEKKSSNSQPSPEAPTAELSQTPNAEAMTVAETSSVIASTGVAVTTSTVVAHESALGEIPAGHDAMSWEEIITMYPVLSERISFLASIDRVVETDARTIDLYAGTKIVMTLGYNEAGDSLVVRSVSHANFAADLITFESAPAEQSQGNVVESLDFMLSSCQVAEPAKVQEQMQEGAQESKEAKEEPKSVEPKQAQKQEQSQSDKEEPLKEEPKKEEPKQECASIVARLILQQVVEKQEQTQETKEEPKVQEQAQKEMPKEEPKPAAPQPAAPKQEAPKAPVQEQKEPSQNQG